MQKNRIELAGFLAAKPELRYLPSGTPVANARLGQTYTYTAADGSKEHTNWFNLSFYGNLAPVGLTYEKGDNVDLTGTLQQREFTPRDGSKRIVYEVIVQRCHLIAAPRSKSAEPTENEEGDDRQPVELSSRDQADKDYDDAWNLL